MDVKSLKGMVGSKCVIMGILCQVEEQMYALEDASGIVNLDLATAETTDGLFTGQVHNLISSNNIPYPFVSHNISRVYCSKCSINSLEMYGNLEHC